jgi:protein-S-isoprenylcysteine O-methyltransferase Ste14
LLPAVKLLLKNLIFTLVVPGTVGVYGPLCLAGSRPAASGPVFLAALGLLLPGGAIYLWCVYEFAVFGRGTPAPIDAPRRLVIRGPYRYTRNPMYAGVLTMLLGWLVMFRGRGLLLYTLGVGLGFHLFIVLYEERRLERQFGQQYRDYCSRVGRWLPRLRPNRNRMNKVEV